ncbi:hypothetical protein JCM6882_000960 [Rhodosporidiobolus microsporus]
MSARTPTHDDSSLSDSSDDSSSRSSSRSRTFALPRGTSTRTQRSKPSKQSRRERREYEPGKERPVVYVSGPEEAKQLERKRKIHNLKGALCGVGLLALMIGVGLLVVFVIIPSK